MLIAWRVVLIYSIADDALLTQKNKCVDKRITQSKPVLGKVPASCIASDVLLPSGRDNNIEEVAVDVK